MIETRSELLNGKSTLIKNKQYLSAKDYVTPFFTRMDPLKPDYVINVKIADQVSITNTNPDVVYNRVHIQAILPKDYYYENKCQKVLGFIYGLDVKNPTAKFYIADIDEDGNLYAFSLDALRVQEIEDSTALNYDAIKDLLELPDNNKIMVKQLIDTPYGYPEDLKQNLGLWVDYSLNSSYSNESGKIKLATTMPVDAYKLIVLDKDSNHYRETGKGLNFIDIYKAFADVIKEDKDIMNNFEKTYLLDKMLGL